MHQSEIEFLFREALQTKMQIQEMECYINQLEDERRIERIVKALLDLIEKFSLILALKDIYTYLETNNESLTEDNFSRFLDMVGCKYARYYSEFVTQLTLFCFSNH